MSHGLTELVERQVRRWRIEQGSVGKERKRPCVALSRLPGSRADELGRAVAARLDYGFFGIEIVDRIAREGGVQRQLIAELDEHVRSAVERYVLDSFRQRDFTESDYLRLVVHTVAILGEQGMAVILGRGAPFVLGPDQALRVLVVASEEARLAELARQHDLDQGAARERLEREDAQRLRFLSQFLENPDDPTHFDLVVNSETLGMDTAVRLVVDAVSERQAKSLSNA